MSDPLKPTSATENEALRATYRYGARQQVPTHLDDAVMRNARADVRNDSGWRWFTAWRRPVAFIATAGLSLAIVLEMSELEVFEQRSIAVPELPQDFATEAAESPARIRQIGETANQRALGESADIRQLTLPTGDNSLCTDDQVKTPESWFACIALLRADGFHEDAQAELDRLLLAYPGFTPPE